jgi:hypothetical protein
LPRPRNQPYDALVADDSAKTSRRRLAAVLNADAFRVEGYGGIPAWLALASALGHLGQIAEAKSALAKGLELEPRISPELFARIWPNMDPRFFELFIDGLRAADPAISDPRAAGR